MTASTSEAGAAKTPFHPAYGVSNIKNAIPILLDTDGHYASWVELFTIHACAFNVLDHIDPKTDSPTDIDKASWTRLDAIVKQWIYSTISTDLFQTIMKPNATAQELWNRLEEIFQARAVYLEEQFTTTRLDAFSNVSGYCARLKTLADQLANVGNPVTENKMVLQLIAGLTKGDYDTIATVIQQSNPLPSFNKARSQILLEETRRSKHIQINSTDLQIYQAVIDDNWKSVSKIFQDDPKLRTKPINRRLETPLMIAVGTNQSHTFVKELFSSLSADGCINGLAAKNDQGDTALHYAAKVGNLEDATLLVSQSHSSHHRLYMIALDTNKNGSTPLSYAAWLGRKEMLEFLFSKTDVLNHIISQNPTTSKNIPQSYFGGDFVTPAIEVESFDIALRLVETYSKSVIRETWNSQRPLNVLARKPQLFLSGSKLGFWGHLIYSLLPVHERKVMVDEKMRSQKPAHDEKSICISMECLCSTCKCTCKCTSTALWFNRILQYLASPIKNIYNMKIRHRQAKQLVKRICGNVIEKANQDVVWTILDSTMATAIGCGNYEVIEECISTYPSIIWANMEGSYLFHGAIKQRQEQVYNLVYQMTSYKVFVASHTNEKKENALHIAARLAPSHRLNTITGAALQMQRELQWFEEIKTFVGPSQKEAYNEDGKTPRMLFTDEHKELLKEGQQWMKDAACSSTVVAALIVTVAFAAVFTLPGGDKNEGKIAFMLFIISDAIALFSSSTSVLMFLGILTSRYAENDFLYVLPKRLTIGLVSLFLSLAATMIAFSATLALVLQDKVPGIAAPLVIITSIPVVLFGVLQFPLLMDLVYSTYGPSIFRKQNKGMIH